MDTHRLMSTAPPSPCAIAPAGDTNTVSSLPPRSTTSRSRFGSSVRPRPCTISEAVSQNGPQARTHQSFSCGMMVATRAITSSALAFPSRTTRAPTSAACAESARRIKRPSSKE